MKSGFSQLSPLKNKLYSGVLVVWEREMLRAEYVRTKTDEKSCTNRKGENYKFGGQDEGKNSMGAMRSTGVCARANAA